MVIREKSVIDRPAAAVWPFIVSPESFRAWNTKVVSLEVKEPFRLGQSFVTHYAMSKKQIQCLSTVTALEENRLLEIRHAHCVGAGIGPELNVREKITLHERDGKTVVEKEVTIKNHNVPWILIPIIWFVTQFGKTTEPDRLKAMCETRS